MFVASFDRMSLSGDSHRVEILCELEGDARQILSYIVTHAENIHDPVIEKYVPPEAETFVSWFEKFGRKL